MRPFRVAVIGAGAFGRRHVELVCADPDCALAAIVDPAPGAAAFAASLGVPHFAGIEAMLAAGPPEAAIVVTPNALHAPAGIACAARGVHLLVEKPIADTIEAGRALVEAASRAGVALLVGHHRRHNPIVAAARAVVRDGRIGRLVAVSGAWLARKPDPYFEVAWRRERGGGPILINLVHEIDCLRFVCGEIESVQAMTANAARGHAVEDTAAVLLRFAGGALGAFALSDATPSPWSWELTAGEAAIYPRRAASCWVFAGSAGSLAVPAMELWRHPQAQDWTQALAVERLAVEAADPYPRQLRHFRRVARGEEAPLIDGADGLRTLAATLAVRDAASRGAAVTL